MKAMSIIGIIVGVFGVLMLMFGYNSGRDLAQGAMLWGILILLYFISFSIVILAKAPKPKENKGTVAGERK